MTSDQLLESWTDLCFAALSRKLQQQLLATTISEAEIEARWLFVAAFGKDVWQQVAEPAAVPPQQQLVVLAQIVSRRLAREPLAQILGTKGFWTLDLHVNQHVLTPRADTETLLEIALELTRNQLVGTILDLGTGSGAIVLAFLSERPQWTGTGVDISKQALQLADQNAKICGLSNAVDFIHSDWKHLETSRFNLIVSNPPYIAKAELAILEPEVVKFEPLIALDGGQDGLDAYRMLVRRMGNWLVPGGSVALEIGHTQAKQVRALLLQQGIYGTISTYQDLGGRDRVVCAVVQNPIA